MEEVSASRFVSPEEWRRARVALLEREKRFTRERDELSAARRALPQVQVDKTYVFDTDRGVETLNDLFKGRSQLIIYHFMFGLDWAEGCPSCSFWIDNFDGIDVHLAARDTTFLCASTASIATLGAYKKRMGWRVDWVSSGRSEFNIDFGVTFPGRELGPTKGYNFSGKVYGEEMPGLSVFRRYPNGTISHAYSTYGRGLDILNGAYHLLDVTPKGRDEGGLDFSMAWLRRRDQYGPE
ncbi:MAG: DUF899 domain-containing protein [Pseudomonadota bacterium]